MKPSEAGRPNRVYPVARGVAPPPRRTPFLTRQFIVVGLTGLVLSTCLGWFIFQGPGAAWLRRFNFHIPEAEAKSVPVPLPVAPPPPAPVVVAPAVPFSEVEKVLEAKCLKCHGAMKQKGGLDLRTIDAMIRGGDSGPSLVPGKPDESAIWESIRDGTMPPEKSKRLNDAEKELIRKWIEGLR
ncbi:MAG: hypothetical protein K1X57_17325 [Gemmataceae bacterium]|nr:hypothetical protein [Gemmataceae bacterium]